jgi:membrane-bound serine protease (ClpP class)
VITTPAADFLRRVVRLGFAGALAALLIASTAQGQDSAPKVYVMPTSGIVDQFMSSYIHDGLAKAQREGAAAALIQLNTPGGDLTATRDIVTSLLNAPLPVIVWVGPDGSRAASAGTFITLASHVAVMSPNTNIGAATPIDSSGGDIGGDLKNKIMQDTEALLRLISNARGRNYDEAVRTVTEAKSYTADEAVTAGLVNGTASTIDDAIALANGATVTVNGQPITLELTGATTQDLSMNPLQSLLHLITDPNIAFILFTVGFYGLLFELQNPNFVTGILGALAIILAFIGFGSLPLNIGGLLLIGLGIILFILEMTVTSHGLLAIGGIICFVLGAAALYTEPGTPVAPDVSVAVPVIVAMTTVTAILMTLVTLAAIRSRRMRTAEGLIGAGLSDNTVGEVRKPLNPIGSVWAGGEEWTARASDQRSLSRGTPVRVLRQEGLTLVVEPAENSVSGA